MTAKYRLGCTVNVNVETNVAQKETKEQNERPIRYRSDIRDNSSR